MPVIKADGYGHGAVPVAKALNKIGVDGFAVAIIEEGIALRKQGITKTDPNSRIYFGISVCFIDPA
ncbi:alanine racemase [Anaerostipes caccae]|uniref:alanine racemase n=1 Tax=Anaerostipes caccae TaxID=105841 RepID=UPI002FE62F1B